MGAVTLQTDSLGNFIKTVPGLLQSPVTDMEYWQKPGHPPEVTAVPQEKIIAPHWAICGK